MWLNILPPLLIIGTLMSVPAYVSPYINLYSVGKKHRRTYNTEIEKLGYARDLTLNQEQWKLNGLEVISD
ncbi:hypothetical protein WN51_09150 [Melipona quadrifasciata]|uniref:Uncharacterized protein n=1 Tax=Melipona quadrifasciata TaxID=166423 RepID=A0A0N0BJP6_9HYME|nr:hypothetical protein WN51_09150 [Melipona quadrifasciata]